MLLREERQRITFNASSIRSLAVINELKSDLAGLEEGKAVLEERRLKLLATARRLGFMDDYELAALSGLQWESVRKMTWGLQPTPVRQAV